MFRLNAFSVEPYDNNVYVLSDPSTKEALVIDAANDAPRILAELKGLKLSHILTTHGHPDHVQAVAAVRRATGALFTCHDGDASMMPLSPDLLAKDGDRFRFGASELIVIHTPGHTPGSLCFLLEDHLFTGDTLFREDPETRAARGRVSPPSSAAFATGSSSCPTRRASSRGTERKRRSAPNAASWTPGSGAAGEPGARRAQPGPGLTNTSDAGSSFSVLVLGMWMRTPG